MTLEKLKKYLQKKINETVFDIIIYGSCVKGKSKPNDIDVLVIFNNEFSLKQRLDEIQKIKLEENFDFKLDIKQILLQELFSASFLARTGIFLEGISIKQNKLFSETIGFKSFSLFTYDLSNLKHSEKVKFNYILAGRNKKGIIEELSGIRLVSGAIKIPIENSLIFEEILKNNKINYNKFDVLEKI
ncbi:MAG: nucleotidyltransferase domain-containing protein [Candidatus Woesearchaeota archaeon]